MILYVIKNIYLLSLKKKYYSLKKIDIIFILLSIIYIIIIYIILIYISFFNIFFYLFIIY